MTFPYYQPNYQPYYPQSYQQPQQQQQTTGILWVSGMQEASMYPVAPNNAVALWEQSGKVIYLKQADATGKPTIKVYDLVERTEEAPAHEIEYATKDDLGAVSKAIRDALSEMEQMKSDLYGVAGRKKKKEVIEDDEQ